MLPATSVLRSEQYPRQYPAAMSLILNRHDESVLFCQLQMMTVRVGQNNESGSKTNQEINLHVDIAFLIRKQSQKWKKEE